jgi:hypothetical protein
VKTLNGEGEGGGEGNEMSQQLLNQNDCSLHYAQLRIKWHSYQNYRGWITYLQNPSVSEFGKDVVSLSRIHVV